MTPIWKFCKDLWERRYIGLARGNEAVTRQELIEPVLKQLGYAFLPNTRLPVGKRQQEPDYVLFSDEKTKDSVFEKGKLEQYEAAISLVEVKSVNHALSTVSKIETPGRFPHQQVRDYLQSATNSTGKPFFNWAILTNGNYWRLYCRNAHPGDYFEFNFKDAILSPNDFTTFYALFRPAAFVKNGDGRCALDDLREESLQVQTKLEDDLRKRVFNILADLANGFYQRKENNINENDLVVLYDNCLIFLYRLLFVLYAEGRGLLPVKSRGIGSNKHYKDRYSIAALIPKLKSRLNYDSDDFTDLYNRLLGLFHLINGDQPSRNKACQVPQYNGGLFDHKQHPLIEKWQVGERTLADVLRGLIFSNIPVAPGETLKFDFGETIDYADLEVRQLGSIYEGLLENHLELKSNHLVLVGDRSDRKATGTYYTPDYIVKYIVKKTLLPLCKKLKELPNVLKAKEMGVEDNSFADEVLKLNILDPAMGSGHFLVRATEFLADKIFDHPTTKLQIEDIPRGLSHEEAEISCWRRRVVESCIYGVDLNPLAVELAKLSLWLTCIAVKQPLSFLDHHLRPGNSLIGANLSELGRLPDKKKNNQIAFSFGPDLTEAVSDSIMALTEIEQMETVDVLTVKDKEMLWKKKVHDRLKPYRTVADLWTSTFFGLEITDFDYQHLAKQIAKNPKPRTKEGKELKKELEPHLEYLSNTKAKRPFHWELEFPEVFFSEDGSPRRNAGFDAVMGNPPYVRIQTMKRLVPQEVDFFKKHFITTSKGNYDIYIVFVEQGLNLLNKNGNLGFILPNKFFNAQYGEPVRDLLAKGKYLSHVVHFGSEQIFIGATTYTCMMFLEKKGRDKCYIKKVTDLNKWRSIGEAISGDISAKSITRNEWNFVVGKNSNLFEKLSEMPLKLGDVANIFVGLQTSADDVFILEFIKEKEKTFQLKSKAIDKEWEFEKELLFPLVSGTDVNRYRNLPKRQYIIFPYNVSKGLAKLINFDFISKHFPKTGNYLFLNKKRLEEREKGKFNDSQWYRFGRSQNIAIQDKVKLCVPRLVETLQVAFDSKGEYFLDNVDVGGITLNTKYTDQGLKYLLGLLNSKLLRWYFPFVSAPFRGGWLSANRQFLSKLPICLIDFSCSTEKVLHEKLVKLVDQMLGLHKKLARLEMADEIEANELEISAIDNKIDLLVYDLYDITKEEIQIIEGKN